MKSNKNLFLPKYCDFGDTYSGARLSLSSTIILKYSDVKSKKD